jgi:preprotein translocase subunit YajC
MTFVYIAISLLVLIGLYYFVVWADQARKADKKTYYEKE